MRKQVKRQLQDSAEYLVQIAGTLEGLLKGLSRERAMDVLAQTQGLALQIGNTIEESEPDKQEVIHKLETVCELLYQISCTLDQAEPEELNVKVNPYIELKNLLSAVQEDIKKNIQIKLEILFLPYQVSMWDSLESVWLAAKEDDGVETYVVPVPFYDVRPDNSLGTLHYEGDKYPDYVPVTPYWQYSIEKRRPDVIFFHNPYDESNTVTRVPAEYYTRNIKKYTDLLVYIPYFISEEGGPA